MQPMLINHIDIPAADRHRSAEFFQQMFGWQYRHYDEANYTTYQPPGGVDGGFPRLHEPHFRRGRLIPQVDSQDIQADLRRALTLGATLAQEEREIPYVGAFALIEDPSGNPLSFFTDISGKQKHPEHLPAPGAIAALVYPADDRQALAVFYSQLLGWEPFEHDEPNRFSWCQTASIGIGLTTMNDRLSVRGEILLHIHSRSPHTGLQRAAAQGGEIIVGETTLPNGQRFGLFSDLTGNRIALLGSGE